MKKLFLIFGIFLTLGLGAQDIIRPTIVAGTLQGLDSTALVARISELGISGSTIWVDGSAASITGTGSRLAPYTTITLALAAASIGDAIIVMPGSYNEHVTIALDSILLIGYAGASHTYLEFVDVASAGIDVDDYLTVDGFTLSVNTGFIAEWKTGETNVTFRNCIWDLTNAASMGVSVGANGSDSILIENCTFYTSSGDGAIWLNKTTTDAIIRNCIFIGADSTSGYAIQTAGSDGDRYTGNYIEGFASGIFPHTVTSGSGGTMNILIEGNTIRKCAYGIRLGHGSMTVNMDSVFAFNNNLYYNSFGIYIENDAQVLSGTFEVVGNVIQDNTVGIRNAGTAPAYLANWVNSGVELTQVDLAPQSTVAHKEGRIYYDSDDKTVVYYNDEADIGLNIGQEMWKRVRNTSGGLISDGTPVYITGATGQLPTIAPTDAGVAATSMFAGLATHDIEDNSNGYITTYGIVRGIDTDGSPYSETWNDGDLIYISSTIGGLTNIRPSSIYVVIVGHVDYAHTSQGRIQVHSYLNWAEDFRINTALTLGIAGSSEITPILSIIADADSDAEDTDETFTVTLTPNADPTLATWGFTSTQSAGYTFDKVVGSNPAPTAGDHFTNKTYVDGYAQPLDADLTALAALSGTGIVARTGAATYSERTITGTANEVEITNGNGVSGNPTIGLPDEVEIVDLKADTVDWVVKNNLENQCFRANTRATVATAADANTGFSYDEDDACGADGTGSWVKTDCNLTHDVDHYVMTETGATQIVSLTLSGLTIGNLYKFNVDLENGTYTLTSSDYIEATTNGDASIHTAPLATAVAYTTFTVYWVAQGATDKIKMNFLAGAGETVLIDNIQVSQVSQAYLAADDKAPDKWFKDLTLDIYTVDHPDSLPTGATRGLRFIPGAASDFFGYPQNGTDLSWVKQYAGRTITVPIWMKTATASHARIEVYNGSSSSFSGYHSGGDTWELISITHTVSAAATALIIYVDMTQSAGQVLIAMPTLSYGNSIGLFEYQSGVVYFDVTIIANNYNNVTVSATDSDVNIVEQSLGKIASGAKAFYGNMYGKCGTAEKTLSIGNATTNISGVVMYSQVVNIFQRPHFKCTLGSDLFDVGTDDTFNTVAIFFDGAEY